MKKTKKIAAAFIALLAGIWLMAFLALRFEAHEYTQLSDGQLAEAAAQRGHESSEGPKNKMSGLVKRQIDKMPERVHRISGIQWA